MILSDYLTLSGNDPVPSLSGSDDMLISYTTQRPGDGAVMYYMSSYLMTL